MVCYQYFRFRSLLGFLARKFFHISLFYYPLLLPATYCAVEPFGFIQTIQFNYDWFVYLPGRMEVALK